jgi:micrococcal nuclease
MKVKNFKPMLKLVIVAIIGAALASFGLNISNEKIDEAVTAVMTTEEQASLEISDNLYEVVSVIDGDTLVVNFGSKNETIRVIGINTPETKNAPQGAECFGEEASSKAKNLLLNTKITLQADSSQAERDKYQRLLAYVGLADGRDFGTVMLAEGFAYEYTYQGSKYLNQSLYKDTAVKAKDSEVGLWAVCPD